MFNNIMVNEVRVKELENKYKEYQKGSKKIKTVKSMKGILKRIYMFKRVEKLA